MAWLADSWAALVDLVLPASCAGCDAAGASGGLCAACHAAFAAATPARVRPEPAPPGLPRCVALAAYDGALRAAVLAYKERGRHELAGVLGDRLADVVRSALAGPCHVLLVPVPATAAAARRRQGDHMARLARRAARRLHAAGWRADVVQPLRALPRPDSAALSSAARARAAGQAFVLHAARLPALRRATASGAVVVLLDDVITTGATLCAAASRLRSVGLETSVAGVLAATQRRKSVDRARTGDLPDKVPANEG